MKRAWKGLFRKGEANVVKIVCLSVGLAIGLVMRPLHIQTHAHPPSVRAEPVEARAQTVLTL